MRLTRIESPYCIHPHCSNRAEPKYGRGKNEYRFTCRKHRSWLLELKTKNGCAHCGFKPSDGCQMDFDHKDGNRKNHTLENLQILCANCHRLKTKLGGDWRANEDKRDQPLFKHFGLACCRDRRSQIEFWLTLLDQIEVDKAKG